jgi:alpha-1,3-glucosyltransferase
MMGVKRNLVGITVLGVVLRCLVGLYPYSGEGVGPRFGDYEAQRHWMEIAVNLPANQWYVQSEANNMEYWGLDYPPLSAYFAYVWGVVTSVPFPELIALYTSRGLESAASKGWMRNTVLFSDIAIYFTAAYAISTLSSIFPSSRSKEGDGSLRVYALLIFAYPLILVDHGHFQYNTVMLGFFLWSLYFYFKHWLVCSALAFGAAVLFKQMALYYAPVLGILFLTRGRMGIRALLFATIVVVLLFVPVSTSPSSPFIVLRRIFPLGRGLFEDKVASFWCVSQPLFRWKEQFSIASLSRLATVATLLASLPSLLCTALVGRKWHPQLFLHALSQVSLSFFLFGFMTHEKSVVLPWIPLLLRRQWAEVGNDTSPWWDAIEVMTLSWGHFGMFPLFAKEHSLIPFVVVPFFVDLFLLYRSPGRALQSRALALTYTILAVFITCFYTIPAPSRYPDLYDLLCSFITFVFLCLMWFRTSLQCLVAVAIANQEEHEARTHVNKLE